MKNFIQWTLALAASAIIISCDIAEDPGPLQDSTEEYGIIDFDRLEMGSGFNITVEQGNTFLIRAEGDRRNLNDLDVYKSGNTLVIEYDEQQLIPPFRFQSTQHPARHHERGWSQPTRWQ